MKKIPTCGLLLAAIANCASATVLTFDGATFNSEAFIPDDYGDRVTDFGVAGDNYVYGSAGGITPNIVVDYESFGAPDFSRWVSNYGDLENSLGHSFFGVPGEIIFTPDPGHFVTIHSFDIGAWGTDFPDSRVRVLDGDGAVHFDSGVFTALYRPNGVDTGHYSFPGSPIYSASALRIEVTDFGDLGIDNIRFSQNVVPIPAAVWLFASGLGLLGWIRRRSCSARRM